MKKHRGVRRRFDILQDGPARTIIDDYAHHPTEIKATMDAAREAFGSERRLIAMFQPHRYSRLQALFNEFMACFQQADLVLVDHVHAAGERPPVDFCPDGIEKSLIEGIQKFSKNHQLCLCLAGRIGEKPWKLCCRMAMWWCLWGAGSITHRARDFASVE